MVYACSDFAYIVHTMVRPLSLAQHTLYADLLEQGADDLFDPEMPENGSILVRPNRAGAPTDHAYYQGYRPAAGDADRGQRYARYLGRANDPDVAARIARFQRVKAVRSERATTVRALIGAGMPRPDRIAGRIIEAFARAGLFPDHAVLIGDAAYHTYDGVLGVRSTKTRKAAGRARPAVEIVVRDSPQAADILAALRAVDPSFAAPAEATGSYRWATGMQVAVTCLDRAEDETANLIGYLTKHPVRALILHGPGVPVIVPAPERFAVHALIAQGSRGERAAVEGRARSGPDQASDLIDALLFADRIHALAVAISAAGTVRPRWQQTLSACIARLPDAIRLSLTAAVRM